MDGWPTQGLLWQIFYKTDCGYNDVIVINKSKKYDIWAVVLNEVNSLRQNRKLIAQCTEAKRST